MKKILFALTTLLFVACGNNVQQSKDIENVNLPEYKLLNIEEPRVSSNGTISPGQNLVYNIEIDHPMQNDSLELLQNYFIQKGEGDFVGINKVIVRAYLKGTYTYGTPYASLNLVAGKKDVIINEEAIKIKELSEEPSTKTEQDTTDPIVGTFSCDRTHDTYIFKSDQTGLFVMQGIGVSPSEFTWKRSGNNITIVFEVFGEQKLMYNPKAKTLTEKSESFGTLVFHKQ